jgi:DNA-binding CsgD family transcriptional regulator
VRWWLLARLQLLVAERANEAAIAAADALAAGYGRVLNPAASPWRSLKAEALARVGRVAEASELAREELALARTWGAPGALGRALRVLGTVEGEEGVPRLREAVSVLDGSIARLEHAKALAALGSALRRARRPGDARDPLRRALDLAAACDAPGLADHVRTELHATGARPRSDALGGVAALTASERRVVDLAAAGETNRDIAQALYVTPKTVELHLSNAYRKLGVRSRRDLPGALAAA